MKKNKKILIIRFSSIGDLVLTTPVIRCLKEQSGAEVHFITKNIFADVLQNNPYLDKLITFTHDIDEVEEELKLEEYDILIDLHNNLRSLRLRKKLGVKTQVFNKINFRKLLAVNLKMLQVLPPTHIVERYLYTLKNLGVKNDGKGLDFFLSEKDTVSFPQGTFTSLVVGGSYFTKKIPLPKLNEICEMIPHPIVLIGSAEDGADLMRLTEKHHHLINACGKYSIGQSAFVIKQAAQVITSDTGMMHIASAFKKKIFSLWGNTIPEFGMSPYLPHPESKILEVKNLNCRPCSKLGYQKCPKSHFKCMLDIDLKSAGFDLTNNL
ncbi:MAG: glycosyltransferase family 9 protein [Sphingobacteriaceae bacterium]|nr:glycosyltransferase family 9 protein [Sphingobacteriaceae bacterium]